MQKRVAVSFIVFVAIAHSAAAQDPTAGRVDSVFASFAGDATPGCALGVYRDGAIVYSRGYGYGNLERNAPIAASSIFDIGSTSKQFTAASILLLAQDGRLSLDDDVRKHIPELPEYGMPITIRHLLHHTSGIRDYISLLMLAGASDTGRTTAQEALDAIARQRALNFDPGTDHLYSNSGYFLLSQIVERVSGKSMAQFAAERIFTPLDMTATYYRDGTAAEPAALATAYAPGPGGSFNVYMSQWEQTGDGAVHTSVEDLLKWDENFYTHIVGGRALIDELERVDSLTDGRPLEYARGLFVDEFRGLRRVSHGGAWAGYRAELMRIPSKHLSAAVLCNVAGSNPTALAEQVLDVYLGTTAAAPAAAADAPERVELPEAELQRWTGRYRNPATGTLRPVLVEGGRLYADFGSVRAELVPTAPAEFAATINGNVLLLHFQDGNDPGSRSMRQFVGGREVAVFHELTDVPVTAEHRAALAGRYTSEELQTTFTIAQQGDALHLMVPGGAIPMQPLSPGLWSAGPFTLRVTMDARERVSGFHLDQGRARGIVFTRDMP